MYNKEEIINSLDEFLAGACNKLTNEEIEHLIYIRSQLNNARREEKILEWVMEVVKFIVAFHEVFRK